MPAVLISVVGHALVLGLFVFAFDLFPAELINLGSGPGGGSGGEYVTVGLSAEISGGAGTYKPTLVPQPQAVPPPPPKVEPQPQAPPAQDDFVEKARKRREEPKRPAKIEPTTPPAGRIPTEPEPGAGGPGGGTRGSGGGSGGGVGVLIGSGSGGEGVIDSWYVRQVEQRIGGNWLRTSLGQIDRPVASVVSFEVAANGTIGDIRLEKASGVTTVDLAAQRAVRASNPLPPLPPELRNKRLRFAAHFDYPPGR